MISAVGIVNIVYSPLLLVLARAVKNKKELNVRDNDNTNSIDKNVSQKGAKKTGYFDCEKN